MRKGTVRKLIYVAKSFFKYMEMTQIKTKVRRQNAGTKKLWDILSNRCNGGAFTDV